MINYTSTTSALTSGRCQNKPNQITQPTSIKSCVKGLLQANLVHRSWLEKLSMTSNQTYMGCQGLSSCICFGSFVHGGWYPYWTAMCQSCCDGQHRTSTPATRDTMRTRTVMCMLHDIVHHFSATRTMKSKMIVNQWSCKAQHGIVTRVTNEAVAQRLQLDIFTECCSLSWVSWVANTDHASTFHLCSIRFNVSLDDYSTQLIVKSMRFLPTLIQPHQCGIQRTSLSCNIAAIHRYNSPQHAAIYERLAKGSVHRHGC